MSCLNVIPVTSCHHTFSVFGAKKCILCSTFTGSTVSFLGPYQQGFTFGPLHILTPNYISSERLHLNESR